jgi:hypothetical protein
MKLSHLLVDAMRAERETEIATRWRSSLPLKVAPTGRPPAPHSFDFLRRLLAAG